jgi:hypothetical protein
MNSSVSNLYQREKTGEIIKKELNENQFTKLTEAWRKTNYHKNRRYLDKYKLYHIADEICNNLNTSQISKKPKLLWIDQFNCVNNIKMIMKIEPNSLINLK